MTNLFKENFVGIAKAGIAEAVKYGLLDHEGMKGAFRETVVSKMFRPVLPPEVQIAQGKITAHDGSTSAQIDLVLYSPNILPPALVDDKNGLVPIEAALYTIEVKSRLTATGLAEAVNNAQSVRSLEPLSTEHWSMSSTGEEMTSVRSGTPYPVNALFAFSSDLSGTNKTELDRYREKDPLADVSPTIQVICVCGKGYWYFANKGWKYVAPSTSLDEILSFFGGVTNTIPQLIAHKGRPRFGQYLVSNSNHIDA